MRVPFLRSSPAARSTSKTEKRRIFLAGLLEGIDTAARSLASANFLPSPTVWGRVFDPSVRAKLDDDLAFLQTQGISAEALPQATSGQPPSAARRSNAPLICVPTKSLSSVARPGQPRAAVPTWLLMAPPRAGARAHINPAALQYFCLCRPSTAGSAVS